LLPAGEFKSVDLMLDKNDMNLDYSDSVEQLFGYGHSELIKLKVIAEFK